MSALLDVRGLSLSLSSAGAERPILRDVQFTVARGELTALVGESGSGKSMTLRTILGLLPPGARSRGSVRLGDTELVGADRRTLRGIRGRRVAMIFQDPRAHINPVHRIGDFLCEHLVRALGVPRQEAARRAAAALGEVGLSEPERRMRQYPHELSGGMLQRVMIASALLAEPELLLADEPTTALDVTTQSEVMAILDELRRAHGMGVLLVTHDIELAGAVCDAMAVMYAGSVVELGSAGHLLDNPCHPYTAALLAAQPDIERRHERLAAIPGRPLAAAEAPAGCAFRTRCPFAEPACAQSTPALELHAGWHVRCLRAGEIRPAAFLEVQT